MPTPRGPVLLVSALRRELAGLRLGRRVTRSAWRPVRWGGPEALTVAGGVGRGNARAVAEDGITRFAPRLVVSLGYAGGLAPGVRTGDVLTFDAVRTTGDDMSLAAPLGETAGTLLTVDEPATTALGKSFLHKASGAAAVDMEAAGVAAACHAAGVPFAAVKAVTDAAADTLPPNLAPFLGLATAPGVRAAARCGLAMMRRPALAADLRRLAKTSNRCTTALADHLTRHLTTHPADEPV